MACDLLGDDLQKTGSMPICTMVPHAENPTGGFSECENLTKYAYHDGTSWVFQFVGAGAGHVGQRSLALDSAGHPHISYRDETNYDVTYAHFDGTAWQFHTIDNSTYLGGTTSLALDAASLPHILYYRDPATPGNPDLRYAHYDGTSWQHQAVQTSGYGGYGNSLAVDGAGRPHISYGHGPNQASLRYAYLDGTGWQIETVDTNGNVGGHTALTLDAAGKPHIAYLDRTNWDLKYTRLVCP